MVFFYKKNKSNCRGFN